MYGVCLSEYNAGLQELSGSMENKLNVEYYALLAKRIRARDAEAFTEFYNATYNDL